MGRPLSLLEVPLLIFPTVAFIISLVVTLIKLARLALDLVVL